MKRRKWFIIEDNELGFIQTSDSLILQCVTPNGVTLIMGL